jgi:hypothetical protein
MSTGAIEIAAAEHLQAAKVKKAQCAAAQAENFDDDGDVDTSRNGVDTNPVCTKLSLNGIH